MKDYGLSVRWCSGVDFLGCTHCDGVGICNIISMRWIP